MTTENSTGPDDNGTVIINGDANNFEESVNDAQQDTDLIYQLYDKPAWYTCMLLGIQHCLLSIGGLIGVPILLANHLCMPDDPVGYVGRAKVLNSLFFVSGLMTFLQTTFGTRLPILQGASFIFVPPALSLLALEHNKCPDGPANITLDDGTLLYNDTDGTLVDGSELWMRRMRQIQGAIAVSSILEVVLGSCGAIGFMLKFIGPVTITCAVTLVGLSLFRSASASASTQWGIAILTVSLLVIFSQYLQNYDMPFPLYTKIKGCHIARTKFFKMFSVFVTVLIAWLLCWILTITGSLPDNPSQYGYWARTDARISVMDNSPWFRFPYPGQWGAPVVTGAGVAGMTAAVISGIIGSIGDYYACVRLTHAPPIPKHAMNRGITVEGFGGILAGLMGTGCGTTSYAENIAAIGITRVASRRVLQAAGLTFFAFGMLGKIGAAFVLIPDPIIGGLFFLSFGMITGIGMSNLQHVDLRSTRNIFVLGFSIIVAMAVSMWLKGNPGAIDTGSSELDQILTVLLGTTMLVGSVLAALLDNTLPGTLEERGLIGWNVDSLRNESTAEKEKQEARIKRCYDLPFSTNWRFSRYIPLFPEYDRNVDENKEEIYKL